jgi:hypothetical protein
MGKKMMGKNKFVWDETDKVKGFPVRPVLHEENGALFVGPHKVLKGWESFTGWYWFGVEEIKPGYWYGFVQGQEEEWGYFDVNEIKALGNMAWPIKAQDLPYAGRRRR